MKSQTILLLSGWVRTNVIKEYYKNTIQVFEKNGYTVFAPDMPGFGASKNPNRPLRLYDYALFIHEYIKTHRIHPDILIGHSFGGRVIIEYLSNFSFEGTCIVMTGTPGYPSANKMKMTVSFILAKIGNGIFSLPLLSKYAEKIRAWFYFLVGARDFYRASGVMRQTFKNIVQEPLEQKMKTIRVPTLLVWGSDDVIVPLRIAKKMKQTIQTSTLVTIPSFGHGCIVEAPVDFVKETMRFIKTL